MLVDDRDAAHVWDMLDGARTVRSLMAGVSIAQYMQDRKLQLAVERVLTIIGEAARRVSAGSRQDHPEIPWRGIIGLRNVLTHDYGEIKQERIWSVATTYVSDLIDLLAPLLPPMPPEDDS